MMSREHYECLYSKIVSCTEADMSSMVLGQLLDVLLDIRDQNDELIRIAEETYEWR